MTRTALSDKGEEQNLTSKKLLTLSHLTILPQARDIWSGWKHSQVGHTVSWKAALRGLLAKSMSSGVPGEYVQSWFYLIFPLATWMMEEKVRLWNLLTAPSQDGWQVVCGTGSEFKMILMLWSGGWWQGEERERGRGKALHLKRKKIDEYKMETYW